MQLLVIQFTIKMFYIGFIASCIIVHLVFFLYNKKLDYLVYSISVCCCSGVLFCLLSPLILMLEYFAVICLVLYILLKENGCVRFP